MTALRTAAQQALESIDWLRHHLIQHHGCLHMDPTASGIPAWLNKNEAALRAALAEPVQELAPFAALVATAERERIIAENAPVIEKINAYIKALEDELAALRAALAEPVQEPVAWLFTNLQSGDYDFCYQEDEHDHDREMWHKQPLYAAPPQRKPLPEEEIKECERQAMVNGSLPFEQRVFFARAIERAHGIGGQE